MESLIPPLLAVVLCFITKRVLISLLAGILSGIVIYSSLDPTKLAESFYNLLLGYNETTNDFYGIIVDRDKLLIIFFTLALGGISGVLSASRGMHEFITLIGRRSKGRISGQIICWFAGLIVFFDDYANSLIVGNSLKRFTDKAGISRLKLAYIVDSTAAPIATLAIISTWVGYKIGILNDSLQAVGSNISGFELFLMTIPYSFYSIYALIFILVIAILNRDFGPMYKYEIDQLKIKNSETNNVEINKKCVLIFLPIIITLLSTLVGLYIDGHINNNNETQLWKIISAADTFKIFAYAGGAGLLLTVFMNWALKYDNMRVTAAFAVRGIIVLLPAVSILIAAWGIQKVCELVGTTEFIKTYATESVPVIFLPTIMFILSAVTSFTIGTSWGTMAICTPLAISTAWGLTPDESLRIATVGAVLSGSIFGDHCSPISDTTILSSMACDVAVMDHTKTQILYGIVCAVCAILFGHLLTSFGISPYICYLIGIPFLIATVRVIGKKVELK
ncbi:MAG: hypothetical protein HY606_07065 [Planctomycetes bacterium]|nr:hypothetical protein [Planctomycetota bacterium]